MTTLETTTTTTKKITTTKPIARQWLAIQNLPGFPRGLVKQESAGERCQGGWLTGSHLSLKRKQKTPQEPKNAPFIPWRRAQPTFVSSQIKTRICVLTIVKILEKSMPPLLRIIFVIAKKGKLMDQNSNHFFVVVLALKFILSMDFWSFFFHLLQVFHVFFHLLQVERWEEQGRVTGESILSIL